MENKLNLKYPLVVEGKYDKIKLAEIVASPIIVLNGFSAFNSADKLTEIRAFGGGGLIILTDSDSAGTFIRGRLKTLLPGIKLINIFAPALKGRDTRRNHTNKEGLLGVESADIGVLRKLLEPLQSETPDNGFLTRQRAYIDGLCGGAGSYSKRRVLCRRLSLPEGISASLLIDYINRFVNEDEYLSYINEDYQSR